MGMRIAGKTVVVTGGSRGIGAALVARCRAQGARVAVLDIGPPDVECELGISCDVSDPAALSAAVEQVYDTFGSLDVFVSNAGVLSQSADPMGTDVDWDRCWRVNVMAHVHAARLVVPRMVAQGSGWIVNVASAAGLLNQIGDAAYSASKHAAVSFAETLAITYGGSGIGVSVVCPQYVATSLIGLSDADVAGSDVLLSADDVARSILEAMEDGAFLVLPHKEVRGYVELRARDHDRWIAGMQKLRRRAETEFGSVTPETIYKLL